MGKKDKDFEERREEWKKEVNRNLNLTTAYEITSGEKVSKNPPIKRDKPWYKGR